MTTPSTEGLAPLIGDIEAGVDRACGWLLDRIGDDGHPGARHCHWYRLPWALAVAGRRAAASSVLGWVERTALDARGDLREGEPRTGFETHWASYPVAILASGAWHLERYDTANLLTDRLTDFQDPDTGGAFAAHPDHRADRRQDLFPTAQLGMTGLTTGRRHLADGAFAWLRSLYHAQPDLPRRLYTSTLGDRVITDAGGDPILEWQTVTDFSLPRQASYNPGIAAAFLGRYHLATGSGEALDLAKAFLDLTIGGTPEQFDHTESVQVCKFAWGASVVAEATGDPAMVAHAARMGRWFLDSQRPDGSWLNSPFLMARGGHAESSAVEVTAEFVQHLVSVLTALGRASGR